MTDPKTRGKVRRAHERREQSGDTEGLHMDDEQPVGKQLRSDIFEILRRHEVSEQCFAEVAMVTRATGARQQPSPSDALAGELLAKARSALRFAASRSCMNSAEEQAILAALTTREAVVEAAAAPFDGRALDCQVPFCLTYGCQGAIAPHCAGLRASARRNPPPCVEEIAALAPATDSNVQKTQIAPTVSEKGGPGCT